MKNVPHYGLAFLGCSNQVRGTLLRLANPRCFSAYLVVIYVRIKGQILISHDPAFASGAL